MRPRTLVICEELSLAMTDADTRMIAAIRGVLDVFDWETDDRQDALKAIHRIVYARDDEPTP
jgi:hypothetical protein